MRFPRTSGGPPHSLSSTVARGRRADENAGIYLPTSPTEFVAKLLTSRASLNLVGRGGIPGVPGIRCDVEVL